MKKIPNKHPFFSIIIPAFNAEKFIERSVGSVLNQTFDDFEVIVVDDKSQDSTVEILRKLAKEDRRIRCVYKKKNGGTLSSRAKGVLSARGKYVMLMDQDDELKPDALKSLKDAIGRKSIDILHFGVEVFPENDEAKAAAKDYESWINPKARTLKGDEILTSQFSDEEGFDWQVNHKVFKAKLAKSAWKVYKNKSLCTSDDFLVSFILCSKAKTYVALPDSKWYLYHLGAGETFGQEYSIDKWKRICNSDSISFSLTKKYAKNKWSEVLTLCQNKLIEHTMNEMHDNFSKKEAKKCIRFSLRKWSADAVAGELWRFVRDRAYDDFVNKKDWKHDKELKALVAQAKLADRFVKKSTNERYLQMKEIANIHLADLKGPSLVDRVKGKLQRGLK